MGFQSIDPGIADREKRFRSNQFETFQLSRFIDRPGKPTTVLIVIQQWPSPVTREREFVQMVGLVEMTNLFPMNHLTALAAAH